MRISRSATRLRFGKSVQDERKLVPRHLTIRRGKGTQTFQSVRPAQFYCAETQLKQQREEFPLGAQATGLCSYCNGMP
jgi:hypothetical protein